MAVACGVALALTLTACGKATAVRGKDKADSARPVQVVPVQKVDVRRVIEVVGTLAADEQVTVMAEAEGRVARLLVDMGDRVKAGQPIIELDREKAQYRYEASKAALERALAKYGVAEGSKTLPAGNTTPDVQKAYAELIQAEQSWKRADELTKKQLLPKQQIDDAEALYRVKKAIYDSALQNVKNLKADIDANEASERLAERELRDAVIRAPFDAYVQQRMVAPGQFVKLQAVVMSLVKVDPLKVIAEIPEHMGPWIKLGQAVVVNIDAYPNKKIEGEVSRISPAVNAATRAFPFEARVPNAEGLLKPGTFARVRIQTDRVDTVISVPAAALQYRYGVNRVFVVVDGKLVSREVKIGNRLGERVEIASGVEPGESIVAKDVEKLADGLRVTTGTARGE